MTPQRCQITILTLPSWSVEEMRSNHVYFWCVWVIFRKSVIWPPGIKIQKFYPHQKNLWTKLDRLPGWKRVKTFFFYFSNKKSVINFFRSHPVVTGSQNMDQTLEISFPHPMQKSFAGQQRPAELFKISATWKNGPNRLFQFKNPSKSDKNRYFFFFRYNF